MKYFIARFARRLGSHDALGVAAQTSFFVLLSLFPLIMFVLGVLGWFGMYLQDADYVLPAQLSGLLDLTYAEPPRAAMRVIPLAVSLWSASRGMWALMRGVHMAYNGVRIKQGVGPQARALALTLGFALALAISAGLWVVTADWVTALLGLREPPFGGLLSFTGSAAAVFLFVLLLYAFTPGTKKRAARALLPGAGAAAAVWLTVNWAFGRLADMIFANNPIYGGASAFLAVALWIYAVSVGIILGAELNAVFLSRYFPDQAGAEGAPPRP
ncbi:MAG: YihY/virulence factor BrkB family protein [Oscillospiraceae bacterium]|nr:YihY/virulence factor BrkB family protein [Oscillospiraceae bacterium]